MLDLGVSIVGSRNVFNPLIWNLDNCKWLNTNNIKKFQ